MGTDYVLEMEQVTVRYPDRLQPALCECSLKVRGGERVALLGLNGSGKSTLILAAVGILPFSGRIQLLGEELTSKSARRLRRGVGFLLPVPEDQILLPTVLEDVALTALRSGWPRQKALSDAQETLKALGIAELSDLSPHRISHGERLRVALAGALVTRPPLLLLDEPTGGLDPLGRRQLAQLLISLPSAMLIATHDLDFASRTCTRYVLLEGGKVTKEGNDCNELDSMWDPGTLNKGVDRPLGTARITPDETRA